MSFSNIVHRIESNIDREVRALTIGVFGSVIRMTPVDSGRAKGNWQCTIGAPVMVENWQSDSESAMRGTVPRRAGSVVYLTNNVPYINRLEYEGWSQQAPAGMVRVSIARFTQ